MPKSVQVTLIGKPGCHLCDDARVVVQRILGEFEAESAGRLEIHFTELDINQDAALADRYREEIPVLTIDGRVHNYWRIDPVRLRAALDALAADSV